MKVCVFGTGAIGSHIAARLIAGGVDVSVIARGAQLEAIQRDGIRVETAEEESVVNPRATDDPKELDQQDVVLVTVKSPSLPAVAATIKPLLKSDTPIVFIMNGIPWWYYQTLENKEKFADSDLFWIKQEAEDWKEVGLERAVGGVINSSCTITGPGSVHVDSSENSLILGSPDGSMSPLIEGVATALNAGGLTCLVTKDIQKAIWNKLIFNMATGPVCSLSRSPVNVAFADPTIQKAVRTLVAEGTAIAESLGCEVSLNVNSLIKKGLDNHHKPSILQDIEAGRATEIRTLYVIPLLIADHLGIQAPTLKLLTSLIRPRS